MKKPGDTSPDPPGGRAAERLRQFKEARLPPSERDECEEPAKPTPEKSPHSKTNNKRPDEKDKL